MKIFISVLRQGLSLSYSTPPGNSTVFLAPAGKPSLAVHQFISALSFFFAENFLIKISVNENGSSLCVFSNFDILLLKVS